MYFLGIVFLVLFSFSSFALEENPKPVQYRPTETRRNGVLIITCPEAIRLQVKDVEGWNANPCAAKYVGKSPTSSGGIKGQVQCYYEYACGGGKFSISKKYPGLDCRPGDGRTTECLD